jgi:AcrR family transcriptional regulator
MSPRPRTLTDGDVLQAAGRVIGRVGPNRLTLAAVAAEVGLAPATLLQRFGSKRALLLAVAEQAAATATESFTTTAAAAATPLDALLQAMSRMARVVATPEELANQLAFLEMDLNDPEFHRLALQHASAVRDAIQALLAEAVAAGQLRGCDPAVLAHAVQVTYNGSLLTWAIYRQGQAADQVRHDLALLLEPYRSPNGRQASRS